VIVLQKKSPRALRLPALVSGWKGGSKSKTRRPEFLSSQVGNTRSRNSKRFKKPERSLPCSQYPAMHSVMTKNNQIHAISPDFDIHFSNILPPTPSPTSYLPLGFQTKTVCALRLLISPLRATYPIPQTPTDHF
jgi:hypothetical protein